MSLRRYLAPFCFLSHTSFSVAILKRSVSSGLSPELWHTRSQRSSSQTCMFHGTGEPAVSLLYLGLNYHTRSFLASITCIFPEGIHRHEVFQVGCRSLFNNIFFAVHIGILKFPLEELNVFISWDYNLLSTIITVLSLSSTLGPIFQCAQKLSLLFQLIT